MNVKAEVEEWKEEVRRVVIGRRMQERSSGSGVTKAREIASNWPEGRKQ